MTTRNEKLSRLAIGSPCPKSWDGMQGDARRRHCRECDRYVHDLGQMMPREIEALVEASRGHLCARITRDAQGCLVTLEPGSPPPATAHAYGSWRASPVAAAVVTTLLGIGSAAAVSPAPAPPAATGTSGPGAKPDNARPRQAATAGAGLRGRIVDEKGAPVAGAEVTARNGFDGQERSAVTGADGRFELDGLAAGVYDLLGQRDGFEVNGQSDILVHPGEEREVGLQAIATSGQEVITLGGAMVAAPEPLRQAFKDSELVVLAKAGASVVVDRNEDYGEVATELVVTSTFKGRAPGRSIRVYHSEPMDEKTQRLAPGTKVLAFLKPHGEETGRTAAYESADYYFGLKILPAAELEAYGERLTALARLLRHDPHPADVMEWLVATAEEPLTRQEATGELSSALAALAAFAETRGTTTDQAAQDLRAVVDRFVAEGGSFGSDANPALLGAFLTEAQKERLSEAFRATPRLTEADLELFALIRPWEGDAAVATLARKLQAGKPSEDGLDRQVMDLLATELDDAELKALLKEADAKIDGYSSAMPKELTDEDEKLVEEKVAATLKELRRRFVQALGGRKALPPY